MLGPIRIRFIFLNVFLLFISRHSNYSATEIIYFFTLMASGKTLASFEHPRSLSASCLPLSKPRYYLLLTFDFQSKIEEMHSWWLPVGFYQHAVGQFLSQIKKVLKGGVEGGDDVCSMPHYKNHTLSSKSIHHQDRSRWMWAIWSFRQTSELIHPKGKLKLLKIK